jgi:hypothetical protein
MVRAGLMGPLLIGGAVPDFPFRTTQFHVGVTRLGISQLSSWALPRHFVGPAQARIRYWLHTGLCLWILQWSGTAKPHRFQTICTQMHRPPHGDSKPLQYMVGAGRFERPTPCAQGTVVCSKGSIVYR